MATNDHTPYLKAPWIINASRMTLDPVRRAEWNIIDIVLDVTCCSLGDLILFMLVFPDALVALCLLRV